MISTYRSVGYGRHTRLGHFVGAAVWGFFPAVFLITLILARNAVGFLVVAGLAALWMWPVYTDLFRRTYEIRVLATGRLEFEAPLRTFRLDAFELVSIRRAALTVNDQAYLEIRHRGGKFWIAWPIDRFADFLDRLGRLNPVVHVESPKALGPEVPRETTPWGGEGVSTVCEAARGHPGFAAFVAIFPLFTLGILFQETRDNFWPYLFIPLMPAMWWLLMWLHGRGWISFDD